MPIAKKKDIPQDFLNQMKSNLTKTDSSATEESVEVHVKESTPTVKDIVRESASLKNNLDVTPTETKKEKYADVLNIRLSKGRRNEIKAFCTNNGVTVTQYIESSFEFFAKEVAAGNIIISKGGITKVGQSQ